MSIKFKILLYFSTLTIVLVGAVFLFVYTLFYHFREQAFHEEQTIKIETALKIMAAKKQIDKTVIESIDSTTIDDLYDEKVMLFDNLKQPIYHSIGTTKIWAYRDILNRLNPENKRIEQKEELYDVVGIFLLQDNKAYYGICKAYDNTGYLVMNYLKHVLILCYLGISLTLFVLLYYFSGQITQSILDVTRQIKNYDFEHNVSPIICKNSNDEIALLVLRFNELMRRMNQAYLFQKHAVHHISHELKTPISVLVSNFEKMEKTQDAPTLHRLITLQKEDTKSLGDIINSLLEIAKLESGKVIEQSSIRVDELLFDVTDEFQNLFVSFSYLIEYTQEIEDEEMLTIWGNMRLLKAAFSNLMMNCAKYSTNDSAQIEITTNENQIEINFINRGNTISPNEQQYLFQHFFRGENSKGIRGFGLGLVLVHKIISLHSGKIQYRVEDESKNIFTITLPNVRHNHN